MSSKLWVSTCLFIDVNYYYLSQRIFVYVSVGYQQHCLYIDLLVVFNASHSQQFHLRLISKTRYDEINLDKKVEVQTHIALSILCN